MYNNLENVLIVKSLNQKKDHVSLYSRALNQF